LSTPFGKKIKKNIFLKNPLTNWLGCGIIKIRGSLNRGRAAKTKGSAVSQAHSAPIQNADLRVRSADGDGFALGVYSEGVVYIVDTLGEPNTAVAVHFANRLDGFFGTLGFDAVVGYLPTAFIGDDLATFEGQAVILCEFLNSSNVNHF
jgi:hypothetical protein